jgi:UDP-glucuronate 4-epimerase
VEDNDALTRAFEAAKPTKVVHLAAQAGVRYSIENPAAYVQSNLVGFGNILELSKRHQLQHLVYASSSSVYGNHTHMPFSVRDSVDHPMSLYAASKKANELMAHAYSHLFRLPTTGLRFFTVYGPWGRPDMALFLFTKAMLAGQPVPVFNHGVMSRDFTYIDDIVEGVIRTLDAPPAPDPSWNPEDPEPRHQFGTLSRVQHRQRQPVGVVGHDSAHRREPGHQGHAEHAPHAARRRARHLCGRGRAS